MPQKTVLPWNQHIKSWQKIKRMSVLPTVICFGMLVEIHAFLPKQTPSKADLWSYREWLHLLRTRSLKWLLRFSGFINYIKCNKRHVIYRILLYEICKPVSTSWDFFSSYFNPFYEQHLFWHTNNRLMLKMELKYYHLMNQNNKLDVRIMYI